MKGRLFGALALAALSGPWIAGATAQAATNGRSGEVLIAHLEPMNSNVTGSKATGEARLTVSGNTLTIAISMQGVPPGIVHWQHFHGFKDGKDATCPTAAADVNHDGIVDLIETEPTSGTTMVPFDTDPAAMDVAHGTYPTASSTGTYQYHATVSLPKLEAAFAKAFGTHNLDLANRVIFVHGVPASTKLPKSVASLGPIPAQVTIPIACGKFELAK